MRLGSRVDLTGYLALCDGAALDVEDAVRARLARDREVVEQAAAGAEPVYGLNTALGAKLGHRIAPEDIAAFQRQILEGRAVATGPDLPTGTGRAVTVARLISASAGGSGMSLPVFDHLLACVRAGFDPGIPEFGSIGASDLVQNAVWALAVLDQGPGPAPTLAPKDAMALINHGAVTIAVSARALGTARVALDAVQKAVLLSYAGYDANREVLAADVNQLRASPGQADQAAWLRARLEGTSHAPRRVQEALSFRTVAPVLGAAAETLERAVAVWEDEVNGLQDSPAVLGAQAMRSTANFVAPALTLALESLCLGQSMLAAGTVQRMQRMMDARLSGLPRALTPEEGAAAGLVPMQKTAAALAAEVRALSNPVRFDVAPVSETVEDVAVETQAVARRLDRQSDLLAQLATLEAITASQAIDLRAPEHLSPAVAGLHGAVRQGSAFRERDRALGQEVEQVRAALRASDV